MGVELARNAAEKLNGDIERGAAVVEWVEIGDAKLACGDCIEILPTLGKVDAVVTDPPYGMKWDGKVSAGPNGHNVRGAKTTNYGKTIRGDDVPFNPTPWLNFAECIMWGSNHYAARLPLGTTLVWIKRFDAAFGSFLSDAEMAWMKGGHGVYCRRDTSLKAQENWRSHPTEKPVGLMSWCIEKTNAHTILDPFMGSGTTGVACAKLGRKFIGVEIEEKYFQIACRRIEEAYRQADLFIEAPKKAEQMGLLDG